jgi:hypothetical protein
MNMAASLFHIEFYTDEDSDEVCFYMTSLNGEIIKCNLSKIAEYYKQYNPEVDEMDFTSYVNDNGYMDEILDSISNVSGFLAHGCDFSGVNTDTSEKLYDLFKNYNCVTRESKNA